MEWYCSAFFCSFPWGTLRKDSTFSPLLRSEGQAGIMCPLKKKRLSCMSEQAVKGWRTTVGFYQRVVMFKKCDCKKKKRNSFTGSPANLLLNTHPARVNCWVWQYKKCAMMEVVSPVVTSLQFISLFKSPSASLYLVFITHLTPRRLTDAYIWIKPTWRQPYTSIHCVYTWGWVPYLQCFKLHEVI